jgi:hypothetical protein
MTSCYTKELLGPCRLKLCKQEVSKTEMNMQEVNMQEVNKQEPLEVCRQEPLEVCRQEPLEGCRQELELCMQEANMTELLGAGMPVPAEWNRTEPCNKQQEPWACIRSLDYQLPSPRRQPRSKWRNSSSTSFHQNFVIEMYTIRKMINVL